MKLIARLKLIGLLMMFIPCVASATYYYAKGEIQQLVIAEAKRQSLAPSLALAMAKVESNFNPQAISYAGAKGVMQIMPRTAEQVFGVSRNRLFDPQINIALGIKFIKQLLAQYQGRLDIALSHYNGGSGVKNKYGELSVIPATQDYVNAVMSIRQDYLSHDSPSVFATNRHQAGSNSESRIDKQNPLVDLESDLASQNPQVEKLRAIRLHNITRNYQALNSDLPLDNQHRIEKRLANKSQQTKRALVRQWESIYQN